MPHHYQRNVISTTKWCPTCGRMTEHKVNDRRVGTCVETHVTGLSKAQEKRAKERAEHEAQPDLFNP